LPVRLRRVLRGFHLRLEERQDQILRLFAGEEGAEVVF
jgi:hypothetical protein